jgi:hypothetical protein
MPLNLKVQRVHRSFREEGAGYASLVFSAVAVLATGYKIGWMIASAVEARYSVINF